MKYIVNSTEMKNCDQGTIEYYGVPSLVLMERAALSVVEEIEHRVSNNASVLILCGSGNNGGDGIAVGRLLYLKNYKVQVVFVGKEESASQETKIQLDILRKYNVPFSTNLPEEKFDVVVDSIFGIGLCREIQGNYYNVIQKINEMDGLKIAVDIPSGINGDNGQMMGIAFRADVTVTFAFAKIGHILYPGAAYTGELCIKEIGIDTNGFLGHLPAVHVCEECDLQHIPDRFADSNKGTYGKVLVIAGTEDMAGAACFSAKAAYRTGAGLVRVLTHKANRIILQTQVPEAILTTYDESVSEQKKILECINWASVIVLGPGLGQSQFSLLLVESVLKYGKVPCVMDADALNLIAKHHLDVTETECQLIFTPHMGEMSRLCKMEIPEIKSLILKTAMNFAKKYQTVTVLKDARTVIALPNGEWYINTSGNSGMSTGGSGDVLTGIIAGLITQGCSVAQASYLGVYLHGLAGDNIARIVGSRSMMASDIIDGITLILKEGKYNETI